MNIKMQYIFSAILLLFLASCQVNESSLPDHIYQNQDHSKISELANAQRHIDNHEWSMAEKLLKEFDSQHPKLPAHYFMLKAEIAHQKRDLISELIATQSYCESTHSSTCPSIWAKVNKTPLHIIQSLKDKNSPVKAWLQLAHLIRSNQFDKIDAWENEFQPLHQFLTPKKSFFNHSPRKIVLALPYGGRHKKENQAIKIGFLSALYQTKSHPEVILIDSSVDTLEENIHQALNKNPDIFIGFTTAKQLTKAVTIIPKTIPILTLSHHSINDPRLFTINLDNTSEIKQLSHFLKKKSLSKALIINFSNATSQKISNDFKDIWTQAGGQIIDTLLLNENNESEQIRRLLHIDQSEIRAANLFKKLDKKGKNIKFLPSRRNDFDFIFLANNQKQARKITPLLKYYFVNPKQIYTSSHTLDGITNRYKNSDLNGIHLLSSSWMSDKPQLHSDQKLIYHQLLQSESRNFQNLKKFYALGIDAHTMIKFLPTLEQFPLISIDGALGTLYLLKNRRVWKNLTAITFKNGLAQKEITPNV